LLAAHEVNVHFLTYIISTHMKSEVTDVYVVCVIMYNSHRHFWNDPSFKIK